MFEFAFADMAFITSFLFVFAIIYGLLVTAKIMTQKNVNVIIALVFGFFSASYEPFTAILQQFIPLMSILLFFVFFIVLIKKALGKQKGAKSEIRDSAPIIAVLIIILAVLWAMWDRIYRYFYNFGVDPMNALWIIGIVIIVLIFYAVYTHNPKEEKKE